MGIVDYNDLVRFRQLFNITYPDGGKERENCSNELKRQLIYYAHKIKPDSFSNFNSISFYELPEIPIKSIYQDSISW